MRTSWNKGLTKDNNVSVKKISETMKDKKLDNFSKWRQLRRDQGSIKSSYPAFKKDGDLAELMGVILGDGHIEKFPRTERLLIFSNAKNKGFVDRYSALVEKIFNKKPYVYLLATSNCIRVSLYEKNISKRLGIKTGSRKNMSVVVPKWILSNEVYLTRYLRGLYEAEGSESHHEPTCTHKLSFANLNQSLLKNVYKLMSRLGFHPSLGKDRVQISRRAEVIKAVKLLRFRQY